MATRVIQQTKVKNLEQAQDVPLQIDFALFHRTTYDDIKALVTNRLHILDKSGKRLPRKKESIALDLLIETGSMGVIKIGGEEYFGKVTAVGERDMWGLPTRFEIFLPNGKTIERPASYEKGGDCYCIYAADYTSFPRSMGFMPNPLGETLRAYVRTIQLFEENMVQNAYASRISKILIVKDKDMRLSVLAATSQVQNGVTAVIANEAVGDALKGEEINNPYLCHDFATERGDIMDELYAKIGILSPNKDKLERVQAAEIEASTEVVDAWVAVIPDAFNRQCEEYGLDMQMEAVQLREEKGDSDGDQYRDSALDNAGQRNANGMASES